MVSGLVLTFDSGTLSPPQHFERWTFLLLKINRFDDKFSVLRVNEDPWPGTPTDIAALGFGILDDAYPLRPFCNTTLLAERRITLAR